VYSPDVIVETKAVHRPFWVDTHVTSPLKATGEYNKVHDRYKDSWSFYTDIPSLLHLLKSKGIKVAAASRTHAPELAREMLSLLHLDPAHTGGERGKRGIDYFDEFEIYPGSKVAHFKSLKKKTGFEYADMLFFDDESRNRNVERELGVMMILVPKGVSHSVFDRGVMQWRKRQGKSVEEKEEENGRIDEDEEVEA
jgi:magnesium-dependent phosphatase 1